jgi:dTDP-4-dehydrorhamnose reductase
MTRLLITGASGLLGTHLVLEAMDEVEVTAVSHSRMIAAEGVQSLQLDLLQPKSIDELIERFNPQWIVNCAALTDVDACEDNPEGARALNRELPANLARASSALGIKFVHISTDAVFDGKSGAYREDDIPVPINEYGRSKLEGEQAVLNTDAHALVLRTNFFGWSSGLKAGLLEWFYRGLEAGEPRPGFHDVFVSLLCANHLAAWIMRLLRSDLCGLYHLSSSDCLSKYEFGRLIAQAFSFPVDLVQPISVNEAGLKAKRPKNLCLDTEKLSRDIGSGLPTIREGIRFVQESSKRGFREKQKALVV